MPLRLAVYWAGIGDVKRDPCKCRDCVTLLHGAAAAAAADNVRPSQIRDIFNVDVTTATTTLLDNSNIGGDPDVGS